MRSWRDTRWQRLVYRCSVAGDLIGWLRAGVVVRVVADWLGAEGLSLEPLWSVFPAEAFATVGSGPWPRPEGSVFLPFDWGVRAVVEVF